MADDVSVYSCMLAACENAGLQVDLESDPRGLMIRVRDPSGAEVCHTLVGDVRNLDEGALNILIYLKPILSLEPLPREAA